MTTNVIDLILTNLALVLLLVSLSLHLFGLYLLFTLKNRRTIQDVIIMNFSATEVILSCFDITENIMSRWYDKLDKNINIVTITSISLCLIPNFLILIVLTLNRYFEVYLNIKYELYFDKRQAIFAMLSCWSVGLITASVAVPFRVSNHNIGKGFFKYFFPVIEGIVLLVAIYVYVYIYNKIRLKEKNLVQLPARLHSFTQGLPQQSVIKRKKFFLPFLIVLSFFLFVVIPDVINLLLFYVYETGLHWHAQVLLICYTLGYICDALLYIFLQKKLREKCKTFFAISICFCRHSDFDVKKTEKDSMKVDARTLGKHNASYITNDEPEVPKTTNRITNVPVNVPDGRQ